MTEFRAIAVVAALLCATPVAAAANDDDAFVAWARANAIALPTCSSMLAGEDYSLIAKSVGRARVVALGEPVHGAQEPLAFRNCLFRYLVLEQGFTAIALETGLNESQLLQDFVAGGPGDAKAVARAGFTWGLDVIPRISSCSNGSAL